MKPLDPEKLFAPHGEAILVGSDGEVLESVSSTMDVARDRLQSGAGDGYVVLAEEQTAGRGREGRWHCPSGRGLLISVVLRIGLPSDEQKTIGIMGAVAAAEATRRFGVPAHIKWPNDVVLASRGTGPLRIRKLGGVLVEAVPRGDAAPAHILGIGLNVNQSAEELPPDAAVPATSMRQERGKEFDRNALCLTLLRELSYWYRRLAKGQSEHILARWRRLSCLLGRQVRANVDGVALLGTVVGLRSTGELVLRDMAGRSLLLSDRSTQLLL